MTKKPPAHFDTYTAPQRADLLRLRDVILEVATQTKGVGTIEETLKWGQPSFLTVKPKSGSTIRIDTVKDTSQYAMYFICHTHLVDTFRELYPDTFSYNGNRALVFEHGEALPMDELKHCIAQALTYHRR